MTIQASGTFEVKLYPQDKVDEAGGSTLGRMLIDKQFFGDLAAFSKGQMLSAMTTVKGSAGYVAIERVTGTLHGRAGSFVLQHNGTMNRARPRPDHQRGAGFRIGSASGPGGHDDDPCRRR